VPQTFDDPGQPPGILADAIDPYTGEYLSILKGMDPIDAQVLDALTIKRGSGAAVRNDGQRFADIKKVDDAAATLIDGETRRALSRLVENQDIRVARVDPVADQNNDYADVVVQFKNLRARPKDLRAARVTP
jgi:hypothetical protein